MKKMTKNSYLILLSLFVMAVFIGCDKDTPDGTTRPIGLNKSEFNITSQGAKIEVHAKEGGWFISQATEYIGDETKVNENGSTPDGGAQVMNKTLSGDWYTITQTGTKDLVIEASENTSGLSRKLVVELAGMHFARIIITQK